MAGGEWKFASDAVECRAFADNTLARTRLSLRVTQRVVPKPPLYPDMIHAEPCGVSATMWLPITRQRVL